jgi:hypothetical protein
MTLFKLTNIDGSPPGWKTPVKKTNNERITEKWGITELSRTVGEAKDLI